MPARRNDATASYLSAIPSSLLAIDRALNVSFINPAAEQLLRMSAGLALGQPLSSLPGFDEGLCSLCENVFASCEEITLFEHELRIPMHHCAVTMHITPVLEEGAERAEQLLITIEKAEGIDLLIASKWKQEATLAAGVMAAMLAHEVKNPLSGIRGAAQLLKEELPREHQPLTDLICRESDRISDLLTQVEVFSSGAPELGPVNIHEVLQYVMSVAKSAFARHVTFKEYYDPSLPPVIGHRDMLIQLFLNLVKNAAEALADRPDATITLSTAYKSGYRIKNSSPIRGEAGRGAQLENIPQKRPLPNLPPKGEGMVSLPIMVSVEDNGTGIPDEIRARLFEPFVSSKQNGRGLGLAIVAKIASDVGAVVELESQNHAQAQECGAKFLVWLGVG